MDAALTSVRTRQVTSCFPMPQTEGDESADGSFALSTPHPSKRQACYLTRAWLL
jgi:hypothetical protein